MQGSSSIVVNGKCGFSPRADGLIIFPNEIRQLARARFAAGDIGSRRRDQVLPAADWLPHSGHARLFKAATRI
jgi:hypothetical protein